MDNRQGVKVGTFGRQNERNSSYVRLTHTSIFGLCFMSVCLMKSNCYSLTYSSLYLPGVNLTSCLLFFLNLKPGFYSESKNVNKIRVNEPTFPIQEIPSPTLQIYLYVFPEQSFISSGFIVGELLKLVCCWVRQAESWSIMPLFKYLYKTLIFLY